MIYYSPGKVVHSTRRSLRMKSTPLSSPACIALAACFLFQGAASAARHSHSAKKRHADPTSGWHTYHSPDYGFTIQYPPSMKLVNSARGDNTGGSAPVCDDTTEACFAYPESRYKGTNFTGAGIAVNILREARNSQQCEDFRVADYPPPTIHSVVIKGTRFSVGDTTDAGMSHYHSIRAYRALYQNTCFEIRTQINTVSPDVYDPGVIKLFHPAGLRTIFDQVAHTFRFDGPANGATSWKISRDGGCGGIYEYPADAGAEIVAENIASHPTSDRITCSRSFAWHDRRYTLDVKSGSVDDAWLKSSGYPPLKDATVVNRSVRYTDFQAGSYYYVYRPGQIYIFSVSDANHRAIDPGDDPIYRHWLASFKTTN